MSPRAPADQDLEVTVAILAAGMGTRLGRPFPKPLTRLADGRSIMEQQHDNVHAALPSASIILVVGFKLDLVLEAFPDDLYIYNEEFDRTNTAKSLLKVLRLAPRGGVMWLNGDVVFDPRILRRVEPALRAGRSFVCVNTAEVADEEIKYTVDDQGFVRALSKTVTGGLGEAVGINYIAATDRPVLQRYLDECADADYFERGIEMAVEEAGLRMRPIDITDLYAVEVDFESDLARANAATKRRARRERRLDEPTPSRTARGLSTRPVPRQESPNGGRPDRLDERSGRRVDHTDVDAGGRGLG